MATATTTPPAKKTAARKTPAKKTAAATPAPDMRFATVPHDLIDLNLDNVRHRVVVDEDLWALGRSIRRDGLTLPLVLHPHPDVQGRYVVIDGHRRHVSVGLEPDPPAMPSVIRAPFETRGELIAEMLRTYLHKLDLSPVEEAEAYEAMALDGLDDEAIAAMTSGNVRRVRERRRLTGLRDEHKVKLHAGQLNLEQAAALIEFADDPRASTEIERAITREDTPHAFKLAVAAAKSRRDQEAAKTKLKAKLKKAKVRIIESDVDIPGGRWNSLNPHKIGPGAALPNTREEHDKTDCKNLAAYIRWAPDNIDWYCLDPTAHGLPMPGQTDAVDEAADLEEQRRFAAKEAEAQKEIEDHAAARIARCDHLRSLTSGQAQLTADMVEAIQRYTVMTSCATYVEPSVSSVAYWLGVDDDVIDEIDMSAGDDSGMEVFERATTSIPGPRLLLALVTADGETQDHQSEWQPRKLYGGRRAWLNLVGGPLGYEWTPWEAGCLAEADRMVAEAARAAEDDDS